MLGKVAIKQSSLKLTRMATALADMVSWCWFLGSVKVYSKHCPLRSHSSYDRRLRWHSEASLSSRGIIGSGQILGSNSIKWREEGAHPCVPRLPSLHSLDCYLVLLEMRAYIQLSGCVSANEL